MKILILILIPIMTFMVAAADPNVPNIDYEKRCEILKRRIASLEKQLVEAQQHNKKLSILCRRNNVPIGDNDIIIVSDNFNSAEAGTISYLDIRHNKLKMIHRVDDYNAIVELIYKIEDTGYSKNYNPELMSTSGMQRHSAFPARYLKYSKTLGLTGIGLADYADGDMIEYDAPLIIEGIRKYDVLWTDTMTLPIIKPLDLNEYRIIAVEVRK